MKTTRRQLLESAAWGGVGLAITSTGFGKERRKSGAAVTRAVVFEEKDVVTVRDLDIPPPARGEIQIRTSYSTISSGTEGSMLRSQFTWATTPFPCVPGYQRSGVVTAVGSDVSGWCKGDRVFATAGTWAAQGVTSFFGTHAGLANAPADQAYHLAAEIDDVDASNCVVAQVGYNAASRASFSAGEWVVIYGDGLVGQCASQAARARGAKTILVGRRPERLELGARYSADFVVNNKTEDAVKAVRKIVGNDTVPVILDNVQAAEAQKEYIDLLEHGRGQIVYNGFTPADQWADMSLLQKRELTTHFVSGFTRERLEVTLALMAAGKMRSRPLITEMVPVDRAPDVYRMLAEKGAPLLGVTFVWNESNGGSRSRAAQPK